MKQLVIAEKPSVAKDIVKVLNDNFKEKQGYFEGENYIVSFALGHLLRLSNPGEISAAYSKWNFQSLPILPDQYPLQVVDKTKSQLEVLRKLIHRKDVEKIINACDAGREGELIFQYILDYTGTPKSVKIFRLWLQSMTKKSIEDSFKNLLEDKKMQALKDAAYSRVEADWIVGMNATRGLTIYQNQQSGGFSLTPCGRVQTPTLMLVVERELEIHQFQKRPYWKIQGVFQDVKSKNQYTGFYQSPKIAKEDKDAEAKGSKNPEHIWNEKEKNDIMKALASCVDQKVEITEKSRESKSLPPLLYDLTTLQRDAYRILGYSAKEVMTIAQSLYETHKLITYPRTSSQHLPEDYIGEVKDIVHSLQKVDQEFQGWVKEAEQKSYVKKEPRIFDNAKVSDHFAIIPTTNIQNVSKLSGRQEKVFLLIAKRFLAAFFPPSIKKIITRTTKVGGHEFRSEGSVMLELGFKKIWGDSQDHLLPEVPENHQYTLVSFDEEALETKPPARYNDASLLSAMETAGKDIEDEAMREAMKDKGIGTPATRASIIEKLIEDKYILRDGKQMVPTQKAYRLYVLLHAMHLEHLYSVSLTAEWEATLKEIEQGKKKRSDFMKNIVQMTKQMVHTMKTFQEDSTLQETELIYQGEKIYETLSHYLNRDKTLKIPKVLATRIITLEEMKELFEKKKIGPLDGFLSRRGIPFSAKLVLNDNHKLQFEFEEKIEAQDIQNQKPMGEFFLDKSPVYETESAYVSASYLENKKKGFRFPKVFMSVEIPREEVLKLISGKSTGFIKNLKSNKKRGRLFEASLSLNTKGKLEFAFPVKEGAEKKTSSKSGVKSTTKATRAKNTTTTATKTTKVAKKSPVSTGPVSTAKRASSVTKAITQAKEKKTKSSTAKK